MYTSLTLYTIRGVERKVEVESHSEFSLSRGWISVGVESWPGTRPQALFLNPFFWCTPPWHIVHHSRLRGKSRLSPILSSVSVGVESQLGLSPFGVESQSGMSLFWVQSILSSVHSGFSTFGVQFILSSVPSGSVQLGFSTFGVQSIPGSVHSGLGPFGVGSIRGSVHSRLSLSRFGHSRFSRSRFSRWIV